MHNILFAGSFSDEKVWEKVEAELGVHIVGAAATMGVEFLE